jgi:DNA-binding MarR family transcriptional regulator
MGGGIALRLAVQHPEKVRRLVLVSTPFAQDGFHPELLPIQAQVNAAMAPAMKDTPMYKSYAAIAPNPSEFPALLDRMGEWMRTPYDWREDVKRLSMPVMLVFGDADMFRPEHVVEFYKLIGGGQRDAGWGREHMSKNRLAILPDLTHYEMSTSPALVATVLPFLDGKRSAVTTNGPTLNPKILGLAENAHRAILNRLLEGTGLTYPRWVALSVAASAGAAVEHDQIVGRVTAALKADAEEVVKTIDWIVASGFVETVPGKEQLLRLTETGRTRHGDIHRRIDEVLSRIYGGIPAEDLATAGRVLTIVTQRANAELTGL